MSDIDQFSPYHDGSMQFDKDGGWVSYDDYKEAADRIEELEAKLAQAMEALGFYADGEWPQDYPGGVLYASGDDTPEFKTHLDYGDKARTTLAELKGQDDE